MKKAVAIFASLLALVSCCGTKAEKKDIGIQLYSIRELIGNPELYQANQATVFKQIAEMGYTSVEAASYSDGKFYGVSPEQYKADVEAAGLKSLSSHTGKGLSKTELESGDFSESLKWWEDAIPAHIAAGMKYIVVPGIGFPETLAFLQVYCDYFNAVGKLCAENGIKFGFHNHSHEFGKTEGTTVMYDYFIEHTNPEYVFFQMDVYWAAHAGVSPVDYFKRYPGRFALLHIKDWKEVGQSGMVGFDAIFNNFDVAGTKEYIVEMEDSSYGDILRTCRESADYLKKACFVKASYVEE